MEDGYACPVCGLWVEKTSGHFHLMGTQCEHDYIPYPFDYVSSNAAPKMMCRKCLQIDYINGY